MEMGLITDLIGARVTCVGLGNAYTHQLGYVIVWVQVDGVQGYDEDQIALVIPDKSKFMEQVPLFWEPHYKLCHECHEGEANRCPANAMGKCQGGTSIIHVLSCCHSVGRPNLGSANPNVYDEVVFTKNVETIEVFSSWVISKKAEKAYTGECINIMTQVLQTEDGALPQGLTIQNAYTELQKGSKYVVVVVRNSTAYPQMIGKKAPVARAMAATAVPEIPPEIKV